MNLTILRSKTRDSVGKAMMGNIVVKLASLFSFLDLAPLTQTFKGKKKITKFDLTPQR